MSIWRAPKAKGVSAALLGIAWTLTSRLVQLTFCFHDREEVGPAALAKIGKDTGSVQKTFDSILRR